MVFNRDGGWAYDLFGRELPSNSKEKLSYDPEEFDDDKDYRKTIFLGYGTPFDEIGPVWQSYFQSQGLGQDEYRKFEYSLEAEVGGNNWDIFVEKINKAFPHKYKVSGEPRQSFLTLDDFRNVATELPGSSRTERFMKQASVPVVGASGIVGVPGLAASVLSNAVAAGIDTDLHSYYMRAQTTRRMMAPIIIEVCAMYKDLLRKRDEIIRNQKIEIQKYRGGRK